MICRLSIRLLRMGRCRAFDRFGSVHWEFWVEVMIRRDTNVIFSFYTILMIFTFYADFH